MQNDMKITKIGAPFCCLQNYSIITPTCIHIMIYASLLLYLKTLEYSSPIVYCVHIFSNV